MIYVALLRGINVGGKNIIDMKKLKNTFESLGFTNVVTYINSGNIIFKEKSKEEKSIISKIEKAIKNDFQLDIKVIIRNFENIETICNKLPTTWVKNKIMRTDVMFLWDKFNNAETLNLLQINSVDNVIYQSGAILWNNEEKNNNKSGKLKLAGTELYRNMTVRNVNTVRKIYEIMSSTS